jgi:ribosomal protein S18 acetylase RimI-like enzyme
LTIVISLELPYRPATPADALSLAELINLAGEGLPAYLWSGMAEPGETAWDVGRRRAMREEGSFSYRNAVVREDAGRAVAALIGYPLPSEPEPWDRADMPPMFVPLQELEDLAPATWYVNVLATRPDYQGRGYGSELLAIAGQIAVECGCRGVSLIVADENRGALRLYERSGFRRTASRSIVRDGWETAAENWELLVRPL